MISCLKQDLLNIVLLLTSTLYIRQMNPEKKLKLILASLKDRQIIKFFQVFNSNFTDQFKKTIRQISFNCYESVCEFKNKVVSGYGKNSQQSYVNSIRTLIQLLADDIKLHDLMRQSLRTVQQLASSNCQSQKKLVTLDKDSMNNMKTNGVSSSTKPAQKKSALKQQIFEYLNLDNLKISNPNVNKTKAHDKYMSQTIKQQDYANLEQVLKKNKELEEKLTLAKQQNTKLKFQLKQFKQSENSYEQQQNLQVSKINDSEKISNSNISNIKNKQAVEPLKTRNDYLNISQDTKILEKSKLRSVSVQASQTQKYIVPRPSNDKKIVVPKLNLQVLPNYHGKSNKSLNQSLMEVYQKTHLK